VSRTPKLLAGVLLALTLSLPVATLPASANPTPAAGSMTADFAAALASGAVVPLPPGDTDTSEGQKGGKWKGGAVYNTDTGTWMATASNRDGGMAWGSYETEEEAQAAGDAQAAYNNGNGVMAGPGCNPPFVLC
jgi:hypothetical protein